MMDGYDFTFSGASLRALPQGALYWPCEGVLVVSDLHLGKSERIARRGGSLLPPYETIETLRRLDTVIEGCGPKTVICLGDSFDDLAAGQDLPQEICEWLLRLQEGRRWVWIEGNHDPGPLALGGSHLAELTIATLIFRHIAAPSATHEISGHYHPKARLTLRGRHIARPCFVVDENRLILPAFGAYTGGMDCTDPVIAGLFGPKALALLTGPQVRALPLTKLG